jgi:hypothetical protein
LLPVLALGVLLATLAVAPPAVAASKNCADDVISDWYGDGRVDKVFAAHCYREAIRSLPVDVLDYSNAKQDILRALAFAKKGEGDPGPSGDKQPAGTDTTDPVQTTPSGGPSGPSGGGPTDPGSGAVGEPDEGAGTATTAADAADTSGPSSLPIPLLILGGLALLLLAAGGVGYLSRRAQARRDSGPPGPA